MKSFIRFIVEQSASRSVIAGNMEMGVLYVTPMRIDVNREGSQSETSSF